MAEFEKVSVIIPSLDPDEKLAETVAGLRAAGFSDIILVDDGSREDARAFFPPQGDGVTLLRHEVNRGKGAALKTAFRYFLDNRPDFDGCVTADGDGQHRPEDVAACVREMLAHPDGVVLGVRDFSEPSVPARSRKGNRITSRVFRVLFGMKLADTQTGLRAFPRRTVGTMTGVRGDRYEYETNMLIMMKRRRIPYREVTIATVYINDNSASHFRPVRDSLRVYGMIVAFAATSLVSWSVDFALFSLFRYVLFESILPGNTMKYAAAYALARAIAASINYTLNRRVVFADGSRTSALKYFVLAVCQLAVATGVGQLIVWALPAGHPTWIETIIKIVVDTILFFASFRIQHNWVFRPKPQDPASEDETE